MSDIGAEAHGIGSVASPRRRRKSARPFLDVIPVHRAFAASASAHARNTSPRSPIGAAACCAAAE